MATQDTSGNSSGAISAQLAQYPEGLLSQTETIYLMMSPDKMVNRRSNIILKVGSLDDFVAKVEEEGKSVVIVAPNPVNFEALSGVTGKRRLWGESSEPADGKLYRVITYHPQPPHAPPALLVK